MVSGKAQVMSIKNDKALLNQSYCYKLFMGNQENIKEFDLMTTIHDRKHHLVNCNVPWQKYCQRKASLRQMLRFLSPTDI